MPPSHTPRQVWAQQRIDEVYADNAHPYFASEDHRKSRLNAAMLRLNQETAPPNRPMPGQQVISAASLMGDDAFAEAEDAPLTSSPTPPAMVQRQRCPTRDWVWSRTRQRIVQLVQWTAE